MKVCLTVHTANWDALTGILTVCDCPALSECKLKAWLRGDNDLLQANFFEADELLVRCRDRTDYIRCVDLQTFDKNDY